MVIRRQAITPEFIYLTKLSAFKMTYEMCDNVREVLEARLSRCEFQDVGISIFGLVMI